jgi:hypothetical protein
VGFMEDADKPGRFGAAPKILSGAWLCARTMYGPDRLLGVC